MNDLYAILTLILLLASGFCFGQCPTQDISLNSQNEVNQFLSDFPDCFELDVNLTITGQDILNLTSLSNITRIDGSLNIESCNSLLDLNGLNNLVSATDIEIHNNKVLRNIEGISDISSFDNLRVTFNDSLKQVDGFIDVETVNTINFESNRSLESVSGFENLRLAEDSISFFRCQKLQLIPGFNNLEFVTNIIIDDNSMLPYVEGFGKLSEIPGNCIIEGESITKLLGFNNVASMGNAFLRGEFDSIEVFNEVEVATGQFIIGSIFQESPVRIFSKIKSLKTLWLFGYDGGELLGFSNLEMIRDSNQFLWINGCNFNNLDFLNQLETISGFRPVLKLTRNPNLTDISALDGITSDSVFRVEIERNPMLSVCHSDLVCDVLERGPTLPASKISENAPGCNSIEEVIALCDQKEDEDDEDPNNCPTMPILGMQINNLGDLGYEIVYNYENKRMVLEQVSYEQVGALIEHFTMEKYVYFDASDFKLETLCQKADPIAKGDAYVMDETAIEDDQLMQAVLWNVSTFTSMMPYLAYGECVKL